ncbi:MAG: ribosome biogenesis/translation initiation ATPase RLI [Sulfolobales archaeon]
MVRIAVIDYDLCRPDKCSLECVRFCPINRSGSKAIELSEVKGGKPIIYELVCVGCGICVRKCPYKAITVTNLPDEIEKRLVHRYGVNSFKLYGLPTPIGGKVLGVVGKNGIGKTTAVKILSGELIPNLGNLDVTPSWDPVLKFYRGSEMYQYLSKLVDKKLRVVHKIQHVDLIRKYVKGFVKDIISRIDEKGMANEIRKYVNLDSCWDSSVATLSGGELQKFAIAAALLRDADVFFFDEPSSYLDVHERLKISRAIREFTKNKYVIVVEHDLTILDYVSDYVSIVYGDPGVFGIFSKVYSVGSGVNNFLIGYLPSENMRIRAEPIIFNKFGRGVVEGVEEKFIRWPNLRKVLNGFELSVEAGDASKGEVLGLVGPNAIGKTTFIRLLAGELEPDEGYLTLNTLRISHKPQYVKTELFEWSSVEEAFKELCKSSQLACSDWFQNDVIKRLNLHKLFLRGINELSGGELQKFAIAVALARDADIYLLDEPSAFIDVDERLTVCKAIKKVVEVRKAVAFVVDHDLTVIDNIADRVVVFKGIPGVSGRALSPASLKHGMNTFLKDLDITFRRDRKTGRPRINKPYSYLDRYQKSIGEYFYEAPVEEPEEG